MSVVCGSLGNQDTIMYPKGYSLKIHPNTIFWIVYTSHITTDNFGYSDTGYSDSILVPKRTFLLPIPTNVTVSEVFCIAKSWEIAYFSMFSFKFQQQPTICNLSRKL